MHTPKNPNFLSPVSRMAPSPRSRVLAASLVAALVLTGCAESAMTSPPADEPAVSVDSPEQSHSPDVTTDPGPDAPSRTTTTYTVEPDPELVESLEEALAPPPGIGPLPSVSEPAPSEDIDRDGPLGAIAAATYFLDLRHYAYDTGDTSALAKLSSPDCEVCQGWIGHAQQVHAAGGRMRFGEAVLTRGPDVYVDEENEGVRWVLVEDEPGITQIVDADGAVAQQVEGGKSREQWIAVSRESGEWVVQNYEALEQY